MKEFIRITTIFLSLFLSSSVPFIVYRACKKYEKGEKITIELLLLSIELFLFQFNNLCHSIFII